MRLTITTSTTGRSLPVVFTTTTTLLLLLLLLSIAVAGVDAQQHVYDMPLEEVVALLGTMPECGVSFFFFFFSFSFYISLFLFLID